MKTLSRYIGVACIIIMTFILTACNSQPDFDVTLENGNDLAIETDYLELTNQEVFELVAGGHLGWVNPGLLAILDWADEVLLSEIDIDEVLSEHKQSMIDFFGEEAVQEIIEDEGFESIDEYFETFRLEIAREQVVLNAIEITEQEIDEVYERTFASDDDDEDDADEDGPTTEEIRELIADALRDDALNAPGFDQEVLAKLRADANFVIHSNYFANHYEDFLELWLLEDIDVQSSSEANIIASINGQNFTVDDFFTTVLDQFALLEQANLLTHINTHVLQQIYNIDDNDIREDINEAKLSLLQLFYPQMQSQGLFTEQQIFDFFMLSRLQNEAFEEHFGDINEARVQELYDEHVENITRIFEIENTPQRSARHILVRENDDMTIEQARALAEDIISQLQAADANEVEDLFIELAGEHGTDNTADNGGDLGIFGLGRMVPEFEEATFALELNTFTTEPVKTIHGYHVIYLYDIEELVEVEPLEIPTLEEIRETLIANELQRLRSDARYFSNIMFELRASQNIRFHHEGLQIRYEELQEQIINSFED